MNAHQETNTRPDLSSQGTAADYVAAAGFVLAILAGIAAALSGLGYRFGWWHFTTGFAILRGAAYCGIGAAAVSLIGGITVRHEHRRSVVLLAAAGILLGLVTAGIPWSWMRTAQQVPRIHDITTDIVNPPQFVSVIPLRKDAANPAEYGGPDIAAQQRAAYPDIGPLVLPVPLPAAYERALRAAEGMGWRIVDANAGEGRIEATETSLWFGFKDDIVVRITPVPGGSRIDVRSVSRVGKSDVGVNAKRIRMYLRELAGMDGRSS